MESWRQRQQEETGGEGPVRHWNAGRCKHISLSLSLLRASAAASTQCYVRDKEECDGLLRAIHTVPCVGKKAAWARRWIGDGDSCFAERLVAFACVEGIHFSGRCVQEGARYELRVHRRLGMGEHYEVHLHGQDSQPIRVISHQSTSLEL